MDILYVVKEISESAGGFERVSKSWPFIEVKDAIAFFKKCEKESAFMIYTRFQIHVEFEEKEQTI